MKEKIDRFAKGIFSINQPEILLSDSELEIAVETGRSYSGQFTLTNSLHSSFKGIIYSTLSTLTFEDNTFSGEENIVQYCFDASCLDVGDVLHDNIVIVSECGESEIKFTAKVIAPSCPSSLGSIRDSFQFANLAKSSWNEAQLVFMTDSFERILKYYDSSKLSLYKNLRSSNSSAVAMEEFLIAIRKKRAVSYALDKEEVKLDLVADEPKFKVQIKKDNWGYIELRASSDAEFIVPEKKSVYSADFVGDCVELEFRIDETKLHSGLNYARVTFDSGIKSKEVAVTCRARRESFASKKSRPYNREAIFSLGEAYLSYRFGELSAGKYMSESTKFFKKLEPSDELRIYADLLKAFTLICAGKNQMARTLLDIYMEDDSWKELDSTLYGAIIFIDGMLSNDNYAISATMSSLRTLFEQDSTNLLLFLYQCFADRKGKYSRSRRLDDMRKLYASGIRSRFLYAEAIVVFNEEPQLLKSLDDFECDVLRFGVRRNQITKNLMMIIAYLAEKDKRPSTAISKLLVSLFSTYHTEELLSAICTSLIRNEDVSAEAAKWYRMGVVEQNRNSKLPEYLLMAAANEGEVGNLTQALPQPVYMFFVLKRDLEDRYRKYLYANLIRFKATNLQMYQNYRMDIRTYAYEQAMKGSVDELLAIIYGDIFANEPLGAELAAPMCDIIYKHVICVSRDDIVRVSVAHKELDGEEFYDVEHRKAIVDIYTEGCVLFFYDAEGRRYSTSVSYTCDRMVRCIDLLPLVREDAVDDVRALLNAFDRMTNAGEGEVDARQIEQVVKIDNLQESIRIDCEKKLIYHYYDNSNGDLLEQKLLSIELGALDRKERIRLLELMITRDLYHLTLNSVLQYGFEGIDAKKLLRMCSRLLPVLEPQDCTEKFTKLCAYVSGYGRYDESLISYLVRSFNGSIESMYELWNRAEELGCDASSLEERIVAQILFTESDMSFSRAVFKRYYMHGPTPRIVRAFLTYYAYGYLCDQRLLDDELIQIMRREYYRDDNQLVLYALLKAYASFEQIDEKTGKFVEFHIMRLEQEGIVFPFFKSFAYRVKLPEAIYDKYYIEYHAAPKSGVTIHYRFEQAGEEFEQAVMREMCPGIYVIGFVLFYAEGLQYYISEENEFGSSIGESFVARIEPELFGGEDTKYHMLNLIITAKEMNDTKTALRLLENYLENNYKCSRLFKPL